MTENKKEIINQTAAHVRKKFEDEGSGHDWWHIQRVWNMAVTIAKKEKADLFIVELAALLHDIADHKFCGGDEDAGPKAARAWLRQFDISENSLDHICRIIRHVSFKGAKVDTPMQSMEGKIMQDADRLDAIGAIGIARAFAYGGYKNREMYNPDIEPETHESFEAYKKSGGPTLNHFYEKLLLLKNRMNTKTAKQVAGERHTFMEMFVTQFLEEWKGMK